ncbi:MAG: DUF3565 domain-containing protein [Acidobacteriota bacterium]|nr:DUF3565 domain-containing protein [Acidobacteriota bacterium]
MKRKITGFHQDPDNVWIADLECGHRQHVRHNPPWILRPWVITAEGRATHIGQKLDCKLCQDPGYSVQSDVTGGT